MSRTESSRGGRAAGKKLLLGELLIEKRLLSAEQLSEALKQQAATGEYVGTVIVRLGFLTDVQLIEVLAEQLSLPFVRLVDRPIEPAIVARVPAKLATRYRLMPLGTDGARLQIATSDPLDVQNLDALRRLRG